MGSFGDRLKRLLGGAPAKPAPKRGSVSPARKNVSSAGSTNRAEIIAEAMAVYRRQRGLARDLLDRALKDMRGKPPSALQDREGLERALALHRAHVDLSKLIGHDLKRYLVLTGLRQWLVEASGEGGTPPSAKGPRKVVSKR